MMSSPEELNQVMAELESVRVERTTSTRDTDKFAKAICAFANDLSGTRQPGYLLIGVDDKTGKPSGIQISDELQQMVAGLVSDGRVLPPPSMTLQRVEFPAGEVLVVKVEPSELTPVRYKGQIWIRRGPRADTANEADESILVEKRIATARSFDARPFLGCGLSELSIDLFQQSYRPAAIDRQVIADNHRSIEEQLAALRFYDLERDCVTHAGLLCFGINPLAWLPNAYVQFVRYSGADLAADVTHEQRFSGDLLTVARELESLARLTIASPLAEGSTFVERPRPDYPEKALREFLMNAIMHRSYELPAPIIWSQFADRIEIQNPGPLYGAANRSNFPWQTSYRNPILAEAMKVYGLVDRYGRGVERAQRLLEQNGNPPAEFEFGDTYFVAKVFRAQ